MSSDPEETQLAPTEPFITPPTVPAFENAPTLPLLYTCCQCKDYQIDLLENALFQQQHQPAQEARPAKEPPPQPGILDAAGGGLFFTMSATVSLPKEWVVGVGIALTLILALLLVWWFCYRSGSSGAPAVV